MKATKRYGRYSVQSPHGVLVEDVATGARYWRQERMEGEPEDRPATDAEVIEAMEDALAEVAHVRDAVQALRYALRRMDGLP